jgi:hypothetical protein
MKTHAVTYKGIYFGDIKEIEKSDWKNKTREPGPQDFLWGHAIAVASFVYDSMNNHPNFVDETINKSTFELLIELGSTKIKGKRDGELEEESVEKYITMYGMEQILKSSGFDTEKIKKEIRNMEERS